MNNRITIKSFILIFVLIFSIGCNEDLDNYSENPNDPVQSSPDLLLTGMQVATFSVYSGNHVRIPALWVQQIAGTSEGQFGAYSNYDVSERDIENEWGTSFENAIGIGKVIENDFGDGYDHHKGIAKILLAFNFGVGTDLWNDVPFSEAGLARDGNINPLYEEQQVVIDGIQKLLDEGIELLSNSNPNNKLTPGGDDLIFNGDIEKWISAAYMLKARYDLRISLRDNTSMDSALDNISKANLSGIENDMNAVFPNSGGNSKNQWKDFEDNRANYIKMGAYFVELLKDTNDPRLPYFVSKDGSDGFSGNAIGDINTLDTSKVGPAIASNTVPIGLITYTEAKFIEAEVYYRKGMETEATEAFELALASSFQKLNSLRSHFQGDDSNIEEITQEQIDEFVNAQIEEISLENILKQKYVSLFSSIEPYNDFRRTGFPTLVPNPGASNNITSIPVRFPTASTERLHNKNAVVVSNITTKVWWDAD